MFKTEKLLLFLLICTCLVITIVLLDSVVDTPYLIRTVYARLNDSSRPLQDVVYQPGMDEADLEILPAAGEETTIQADTGWNLYKNEGYAFEIQFPKQVVRKSLVDQAAINSGVGLAPQAAVWQFRVDNPAYYQGTNLIDASLLIHVVQGQEQQEACLAFKQGSIYQTPLQQRNSLIEVEIQGVPFVKDEVTEGGMGEFYDRIIYRTFAKGACYELTQLLHYRNLDGLVGTQVVEFDRSEVLAEMDQVLETFTLLDVEPTFPALSYPEPKALSTTVAKAVTDYADGLDVSHWQGVIKWNKVKNAGYVFTFAKGTEGVGWTDSQFIYNMEEGENVAMLMGAYHFARPDLGNSGAAEAKYFLSVAGDYLKSGYLRPVLDLEVGTSLGKTKLSNWVLEWMQTVESRTGIEPLIYTNLNFINNYLTDAVTKYDLWIAYWSCEPTPTYDIPPTGKWRDWAFWQYYGPGGCGANAGYVPGITTNVDLNIFNGVTAGLAEYDAKSHLWVSLTSDAYFTPVPYYADIKANVNGDTTGPINFALWWDCTALEADIGLVEGTCGVLPVAAPGTCAADDVGMRCQQVSDEIQVAEHTYWEIGNYTPKVIVERGTAVPAEDRYKISTYNPLRYITSEPVSPGTGFVDVPFLLNGSVNIHTSLPGALQVSLDDPVSGEIKTADCQPVAGDLKTNLNYELSWVESNPGEVVYSISARYRPGGECPIEDHHEYDISQLYIINWEGDSPVLEMLDEAGDPLVSGSILDLGEVEPFATNLLQVEISNPSSSLEFTVDGVAFENLLNVSDLVLTPAVPFTVGPGDTVPAALSFVVPATGQFSFDVLVDHNAVNPSPFLVTIQGSGRLATNPLISLTAQPPTPGTSLVNAAYDLLVEVSLDAPALGVLDVSLLDAAGDPVSQASCQEILQVGPGDHAIDFSWTEVDAGSADYTIWARYRPLGACPVSDSQADDLSLAYQVEWQDDSPSFVLQDLAENEIPAGGLLDLGDLPAFATAAVELRIMNTSPTSSIEITGGSFSGLENVANPQLSPAFPLEIAPGDQASLTISFGVDSVGDFSLLVALEHTAANPSPYEFSLQGIGVLDQNPLQSVTPDPSSPGESLIGTEFDLQLDLEIAAPVPGDLAVELLDASAASIQATACLEIAQAGATSKSVGFTWTETVPGVKDYSIRSRFYQAGDCQAGADPLAELTLDYQVSWQEEDPLLMVKDSNGISVEDGTSIDLGQYEFYQSVELTYQLHNTSSTTPLQISEIAVENLANLSAVNLSLVGPFEIGPGGTQNLEISFLVENTGALGFDLVIDHQASNPSPYRLGFLGSGFMANNPIRFVVPTPISPVDILIGNPFTLRVDVGISAPDLGALQVSMVESGSDVISSLQCLSLEKDLNQARTFELTWTRPNPGAQSYTLWTRYRAQGECPIADESENDLRQIYTVNWKEDPVVLAVLDGAGERISAGSSLDLGLKEFYQPVEFSVRLVNTSSTSALQISGIGVSNLVNLAQVEISPSGAMQLEPKAEQDLQISFLVTEQGTFGFELDITHSGENTSPYRIAYTGTGELANNPILGLEAAPAAPGTSLVSETYQLDLAAQLDLPAPGILAVALERPDGTQAADAICLEIPSPGISTQNMAFSWEEAEPGSYDYLIRAQYQAEGSCPLEGTMDAELSAEYVVNWQILSPVLVVNRPEGVTIFDGAVDYVGEHDFFRFVEVTYLITNNAEASPLIVESITPQNLVNLREVLIEPALPFELAPGESQEVKITFHILMLEPFAFDLVWEHNGSNPSPYQTSIVGDARLNLGEIPVESWLYRFLLNLVRSGFFLKLPIFGTFVFWPRRPRKRRL